MSRAVWMIALACFLAACSPVRLLHHSAPRSVATPAVAPAPPAAGEQTFDLQVSATAGAIPIAPRVDEEHRARGQVTRTLVLPLPPDRETFANALIEPVVHGANGFAVPLKAAQISRHTRGELIQWALPKLAPGSYRIEVHARSLTAILEHGQRVKVEELPDVGDVAFEVPNLPAVPLIPVEGLAERTRYAIYFEKDHATIRAHDEDEVATLAAALKSASASKRIVGAELDCYASGEGGPVFTFALQLFNADLTTRRCQVARERWAAVLGRDVPILVHSHGSDPGPEPEPSDGPDFEVARSKNRVAVLTLLHDD